ncbi:lyase family protein [Nonomuraea cavernae]|uniref:lyase family protein n=1 Tax=Nonomuraea cavernae TaxID=2045107 RepID=UPI001CDA436D|nr:lyase family protein [Nonomuraea cavernae]MCA2190301.1 3-carboxy-cis,cis-muconate cycloisomerase [Nonomuraea cavernae]
MRAGTRAEGVTSDQAWLRAMLEAEAALARAQARAGLIPGEAAELIARTAAGLVVDVADLARRARDSANPVVPLVSDLREAVRNAAGPGDGRSAGDIGPSAGKPAGDTGESAAGDEPGSRAGRVEPPGGPARLVHLGATSQDIMDSAAMLVATRAVAVIVADLDEATRVLADLARRHRDTPMAARTLGQQAVPTTFGLKAAGWLMGLLRARDRLRALRLPAQLGGAAGTLAALTEHEALRHQGRAPTRPGAESARPDLETASAALRVVRLYAEELGLAAPPAPWHAERSVVAELGSALAAAASALGKVATDIVWLAQTEVGEVAESSKGRSSAMPHKRNPALSVLVRAASLQVPAYASVLGAAGEHERAAGAWQAEWLPLRECLRLTGGAAETAVELLAGLKVFPDRMRANADLTGAMLVSERLSVHYGRDAVERILRDDGPPEVPGELLDPAQYLGAAPELVDRILAVHRPAAHQSKEEPR